MLARRDLARDSSPHFFSRLNSHLTEISPLISPRFWPPKFGEIGAFLAAEIFISPRSRHQSRRVFGRRDFHLTEISPLISARFWPPRFGEISACFWPARFSSRRDLATNLGAFLAAEIWRDLDVFLAGEIFISPRSRH